MGLKFVGLLLVFGLVFLLGCVFIPDVGEDRMTWVESLEDSFLVASFFSAISAGVSFPAPCSEVWKIGPTKSYCLWMAWFIGLYSYP